MSNPIPKLDRKAIRARVGEKSFGRGEEYFRSGAIFDARRQGRTLKARCEGSQGGPYRIEVGFDDAGKIAEAGCSCPVGDGGHCKHVAALLLTWAEKPDDFAEVEELLPSLERRSKSELIALIQQILRSHPELDVLLEAPTPGSGKRRMPVKPETYRRQAANAFRGHDHGGHGGGYDVARSLEPILATGEAFLGAGDHASASAVFEGLAGAIFADYEMVDDEGEVVEVAEKCIDGLGQCLAHLKDDPARREAILKTLVEAEDFARNYGADGEEAIPEMILKHATAEERRTVVGWLRDELSRQDRNYSRDRCEGHARFLIELAQDSLDDDDYLQICRDAGLTADLVDHLLGLGRVAEALSEFEAIDDHRAITLADLFVAHKQGEIAERVIRDRVEKSKGRDIRPLEWLKKRATARRDRAASRELTEAIFRQSPTFENYRELGKIAEKQAGWDALRPRLLEVLEKSNPRDLVRVHLEDGELDRAIEAVQTAAGGSGMRLEVARAAEATRPRASIEIYREFAEEQIERRGRDSYKEACRYLKKVESLSKSVGDTQEWAAYIAGLRERNRSLRAFQEELTLARL